MGDTPLPYPSSTRTRFPREADPFANEAGRAIARHAYGEAGTVTLTVSGEGGGGTVVVGAPLSQGPGSDWEHSRNATVACICVVPGVFTCRWAVNTDPATLVIATDTIEGRDELTGGTAHVFTNPPGGSKIRVS
jgi:hypothetical protein